MSHPKYLYITRSTVSEVLIPFLRQGVVVNVTN